MPVDVLQVVTDDCPWFEQQKHFLTIEGEKDGKQTVTIRRIDNNLLEGWYEVDPISKEFSKFILNKELKEFQSNGQRIDDFVYKVAINPIDIGGTSKILNFDVYTDEDEAKLMTSLRNMFGNPKVDADPIYVIEVFVEDQYKCILTIYNGPSGWAIGGKSRDDLSSKAASELAVRLTENMK